MFEHLAERFPDLKPATDLAELPAHLTTLPLSA
jgi:hypothetical protein